MTKVFISYSHDSDAHRDFVRGIADRLCQEGVDCLIDRYINGFPPEGWPRWMENQIEAADYVLLVCTKTYLRRYRGQETEGGRGVNFEGVVISQTLYDHYYKNSKFIPVIPDDGDFEHVPLPLKPYSTYRLNSQYDAVYRILTGQAEYVRPELGEIRTLPVVSRKIISDDLPTVEGELFGRKEELALLDEAFKTPHPNPSPQGRGARPHIVQFVASGGTGKTKLIRHWLDANNDKIEALIAWSFYSQGSSEDKQISATPFFMQALKSLGSDKSLSDFNTEEEKGEYVANLLREKRCLLVLDGLEPLQQVGRGMRGELKDRAIRKMLRCLVGDHTSLCIITTRLPVHELKGRRQVVQYDLQNLAPEDGVALLRSFGVSGRDVDMLAAVEEYGRHALALHLLGNALATYLDGDVRKRDTLTELIGDYDETERHAFKVMQAYEQWLAGTPELKLLYLLGLFDHPVEQEVLEVLWEAEIPGLTAGVERKAWLVAQRDLTQKYRMMSAYEGCSDLFDCHPLIREYFGGQLKGGQGEIGRQAHTVLYEYYMGLPEKLWGKYLPDTLEEMQPLFRAVNHGCCAGCHQQVLTKIYWPRIHRKGESHICEKLGGFTEDLSCLINFFSTPWSKAAPVLDDIWQVRVMNWASFTLRSLGRLQEALEAAKADSSYHVKNQRWMHLAYDLIRKTGTTLSEGNVTQALRTSKLSVDYADLAADGALSISSRTQLANVLHLAGESLNSLSVFREAEELKESEEKYIQRFYSLSGFYYCEQLLDMGRDQEVEDKFEKWDQWEYQSSSLLSEPIKHLIFGRINQRRKKTELAFNFLNKSVEGFYKSNRQDYVAYGLLARASIGIQTGSYKSAYKDLIEIHEIAKPSGMRLHLTDYHLEMARLILAVEADPAQYPEATPDREHRILPFADQEEPGILTLQEHIAEADRLINETGYHRRDAELAELKQQAGMS